MKKAFFGAMLALTWLHLATGVVAQPSFEVASASSGSADVEGESPSESAPALVEAADQARQLFAAGTRWAREGNWPRALAAYQEAYGLYPHATTLYNIGFCQMQQGHLVAAWQSTAQALDGEAHEPARQMSSERRAVAEQQRDALQQRLATLIVLGPPGLGVLVDDLALAPAVAERESFVQSPDSTGSASIVAGPARIYVNPGEHTISLVHGRERQRRTVALAEGSRLTLEWTALDERRQPVRTPAGPAPDAALTAPRAAPLTAGASKGRGAASLIGPAKVGSIVIAAGGFGLALTSGVVAWSTGAHLTSACPTPRACPATEAGAVERYRNAIKLTNAGLLTGLAGSAIGLGLVLLGADQQKATSLSATPGGVRLVSAF